MLKRATGFGEGNDSVVKGTSVKKKVPVFGIDLGTTNSAISVVAAGTAPKTIELHNGRMTMPSCVMWRNGEFVVGYEAYKHRGDENVIYSVKRMMQDRSAKVILRDNGETAEFTPAEISAEILKGLIAETDGVYGEIKDVVVTVPAYFDQNGISATREACELAGLNLIGIANEPTAASLCYQLDPDSGEEKDVLVYDLGGGTFDVTIMRLKNNSDGGDAFEMLYGGGSTKNEGENKVSVVTLGISGDMHLGGDDIDYELLKIILKRLKGEGVDTTQFTSTYKEQLLLRLENYKKDSVNAIYNLNIDTIGKNGKPIKAQVQVASEDFAKSAEIIFAKTKKIVDDLLRRTENNVCSIVCTGGSTKNSWIQRKLAECYSQYRIDNALSPDLSVSQGAAIQGRLMKFGDNDIQIFDILPLTIGVLTEQVKSSSLIPNGTPLPVTKSMLLTTERDNQTAVEVTLLQGNSVDADECVPLGSLRIDDIEPRPAGEAELQVIVSITANRLMKCMAKIDGIEKELTLDLSGDLGERTGVTRSRDEKILARLKRAGILMGEEKRAALEGLLNDYESGDGSVSIEDIKEFVKQNRKSGLDET